MLCEAAACLVQWAMEGREGNLKPPIGTPKGVKESRAGPLGYNHSTLEAEIGVCRLAWVTQ